MSNWYFLGLLPVIFVLVYIGIYHPGDTGRCLNCGTPLKRKHVVCPNCKTKVHR